VAFTNVVTAVWNKSKSTIRKITDCHARRACRASTSTAEQRRHSRPMCVQWLDVECCESDNHTTHPHKLALQRPELWSLLWGTTMRSIPTKQIIRLHKQSEQTSAKQSTTAKAGKCAFSDWLSYGVQMTNQQLHSHKPPLWHTQMWSLQCGTTLSNLS
jgi:hypothetical protein